MIEVRPKFIVDAKEFPAFLALKQRCLAVEQGQCRCVCWLMHGCEPPLQPSFNKTA